MYFDHELRLVLIAAFVGSTPIVPFITRYAQAQASEGKRLGGLIEAGTGAASIAALALIFLVSAMQLSASTHNPFIYFRF